MAAPVKDHRPFEVDAKNVQGDVLLGLPKDFESFLFFRIEDAEAFKKQLSKFIPDITTTEEVQRRRKEIMEERARWYAMSDEERATQERRNVETRGINIAFSSTGMKKLKIEGDLKDEKFNNGQEADAKNLGDPFNGKRPAWDSLYLQEIHGVFLVADRLADSVKRLLTSIRSDFSNSISEIGIVDGRVREGKYRGFEHFGFMDGLSEPSIKGFGDDPPPKIRAIDPGIILLGMKGDSQHDRPVWALGGSFLCFRQLKQLVPEFNSFTADKAKDEDDFGDVPNKAEFLRARMFGRWQSGCPLDKSPWMDDTKFEKDNDYNFKSDPQGIKCPLASHTRKMFPRDLPPEDVDPHRIIRTGIPYGEDVADDENQSGKTTKERGLLFACYQSSLVDGYSFLQQFWSNNVTFPPPPKALRDFEPGFDPIVGINDSKEGPSRTAQGLYPYNQDKSMEMPADFVVPLGGEYFFSPSIEALTKVFAK